jgi:hypothetical protein
LSTPRIVAATGDAKRNRPVDHPRAWAVLGWTALAFLVVGGFDFALTWYPPDFGNREWEFGTVTASLNGLPILLIGIALLLAASIQTGRRWWAILATVASLVMLVWVAVGAVLWATNVPLALESVPPELAVGIKKSLAKTVVQSVVYPLVLTFLLVRAAGALRHGDRPR